jgi:ABC-2 type transport system permease protein
VVTSERKGSILKKMRVSQMSKLKFYIGKFIPCTLAIFFEVSAAWVLSVLLLDIHWGRIGDSILIVFLTSMAAAAFGIILFQLFNNAAISIVAAFIVVWVAGFFGGVFESYMYLFLPQWLMKASPIYYINRTLVEFSTKGYSNYEGSCIAVLAVVIIVCGLIGTLLMNRKLEEQ